MRTVVLKPVLFLGVLAVVLPQRAQGQEREPGLIPVLTLDDAVSIAKGSNKTIQVSGLDVARAREKVAQVKTNYLPQLASYVQTGILLQPIDFTIPAGTLGTFPATGPIPATDAAIRTPQQLSAVIYASAGQPLTQLFKVKLAVQQAHLGIDLANEGLRAKEHDTIRQVKEAYYQIVHTQSQVEDAIASVKYLEELSAVTESRLAEKTVLLSDSLAIKARTKQQRYQLLALQDALEVQKQALNRLLGRDLRTSFAVEAESAPAIEELDLETARSHAVQQRPEIRQARLQSKMAELDARREKAEYIPDVSAQVSYLSFQNITFVPQNVGFAGLLLKWQPFDWGMKRHRISELKTVTKQYALTEQDIKDQVLLDVEQTFRKLAAARVLLDAQNDMQQAERERLRESTHRYEQKVLLLFDLLERQTAVSQAEAQYQQALSAFWTARAEFERALGMDQ